MEPGLQSSIKTLARLQKEMRKIYEEATSTVGRRILTYSAGFLAQDTLKRKLLSSDIISKDEYKRWKLEKVFSGLRWQAVLATSIETMLKANRRAREKVDDTESDLFCDGANEQLYDLEKKTQTDTGIPLYDRNTVKRLREDDPELLPRRKGDENKDRGWQQTRIANAITQSLILGESIPKTAKRLSETLGNSNMKTMTRYARTAVTSAQNAGRMEAMRSASEKGIHVQKRWKATLDSKTRDSHQYLDGQVQEIDDPFISLLGKIRYPGDVKAHPGDVWNCRCGLTYVYPDFKHLQRNQERRDNETKQVIPYQTYAEWKEAKQASEGQPRQETSLQQKILRAMVDSYQADAYDEAYKDSAAELKKALDAIHEKEEELLRQYQNAKSGSERAQISKQLSDLTDERGRIQDDARTKYAIERAANSCKECGVGFEPVEKLNSVRPEDEIISRLAGGDKTSGSCASLGFAYVGQKAGLDVLDFRGGESRSVFAQECKSILDCLRQDGLPLVKETARSYITAGKRTLSKAKDGKQYYFECGRHAAIVRNQGGKLQYLELQSGYKNGWMDFGDDIGETLNWRFGAPKSSRGYDVSAYLLGVDEMAASQRLLKILGYINTQSDRQKKGAGGHER